MESFIAELGTERLEELQAYLLATGLKDYNLTTSEEQALEAFNSGEVEWGKYKLGDLFEINSYKKRFDANKVEVLEIGEFPYIVRMGSNNGQKGYINEDIDFLNAGNTISFGQDTATMFYQEKPYFTGDKIKILKSKDENFKKNNAQFFISAMSKAFSSFSWGSSSFSVEIIEGQNIQLPTQNNQPDYSLMKTLNSAVQKLVIKEVVLYADKKLVATKEFAHKS